MDATPEFSCDVCFTVIDPSRALDDEVNQVIHRASPEAGRAFIDRYPALLQREIVGKNCNSGFDDLGHLRS